MSDRRSCICAFLGEKWYANTHCCNACRLKDHEITLCYNAAVEHYERVMQTVKSRGLAHELREGFDVLRERGFGRYDMTVPEYEKFDFITSPNAAWMPIVHRCLGPNVERVHTGCFLSLPGSHHQIYHQDGVHLNDKIQKVREKHESVLYHYNNALCNAANEPTRCNPLLVAALPRC